VDKELATTVAAAVFRSGSSLEKLIPKLKARCTPDECATYVKAIAYVMGTMHDEILLRLFAAYPELKDEIDHNVNTTGRAF
jgi:hypothetical protein